MNESIKGNKILDWLAYGRVGASSKCMAMVALGREARGDYPSDPSDLNRCLQLIKAAPEVREAFPKIAALHESWNVLIENWDELEASFVGEVGDNWSKGASAPKTYQLMKNLLAPTQTPVQKISDGRFMINIPENWSVTKKA